MDTELGFMDQTHREVGEERGSSPVHICGSAALRPANLELPVRTESWSCGTGKLRCCCSPPPPPPLLLPLTVCLRGGGGVSLCPCASLRSSCHLLGQLLNGLLVILPPRLGMSHWGAHRRPQPQLLPGEGSLVFGACAWGGGTGSWPAAQLAT